MLQTRKYRTVLKYKNYDVHAITSFGSDGRTNANIATWVMQTAMGGKELAVALYLVDYTIELVRETGILNINLLAEEQAKLIPRLGRKSGRNTNKLARLPHGYDTRGCPYLMNSVGYVQCKVVSSIRGIDHEIFICEVIGQVVLNPAKKVLTNQFLRDSGLVRG